MREIRIGGKTIGDGEPVFIIAEVGVNHNGDLALAKQLIDVAAAGGADAVKFQTFKADRVVSPGAPKAAYQRDSINPKESQLDLLRRLELSPAAHRELHGYCGERGIQFLSAPFDEESADLLEALGVPAFKIGSGEITNFPLLDHIARKGKPILLSTGMSYLDEVEAALKLIRDAGNDQVALLHCVSTYPANPADANLRAMRTMAEAFHVPVGYSDHTPGIAVALAAVALGACLLEKHVTLDRNLRGPDHGVSLEPDELRELVRSSRVVETALGLGAKAPATAEGSNRLAVRRSLAVTRDVPQGAVLQRSILRPLRPGGGIQPALLETVAGRKVKRPLSAGQLISWDDLE